MPFVRSGSLLRRVDLEAHDRLVFPHPRRKPFDNSRLIQRFAGHQRGQGFEAWVLVQASRNDAVERGAVERRNERLVAWQRRRPVDVPAEQCGLDPVARQH